MQQAPTTHRAGSGGRRVDYFPINHCAEPFLHKVSYKKTTPLVNHFAVELQLKMPVQAPRVEVLKATTKYHKQEVGGEALASALAIWDHLADRQREAWQQASGTSNIELMWQLWNEAAESTLRELAPEAPTGRPKGTVPTLQSRLLWAPAWTEGVESN